MGNESQLKYSACEREAELMRGVGTLFIRSLEALAKRRDALTCHLRDWEIIANWLGCQRRALSPEDGEKIDLAWQAYMARGVVPSRELRSAIDSLATSVTLSNLLLVQAPPPSDVMNVFYRLLSNSKD